MESDDHTYSQESHPEIVLTKNIVRRADVRKRITKIKAEDEEKPYGCTECHKRFTRKGDMCRHLRTHTGERPFSCPECGDEFSRKDDMIRHLRTHTGLRPYDCTHCERKFSRRSDMFKHMVVHSGVKVKENGCPTCGCSNSNHCHDEDEEPPVVRKRGRPKGSMGFAFHKCGLCSNAFSRKRDLSRHLRSHSLLDIINMSTNNGSTVITNKENESHDDNVQDESEVENVEEMVEEDSTSSLLPECKVVVISNTIENGIETPGAIQIVTTDKALQNALLGIKNDKPFLCPQCGDKFGRKSDMIRHLRIHSGVKPFTCHLCARPFSRKEDMNRHVFTHSGMKPFPCSICSKSFARKCDYEMHVTLHSMESAEVCKIECVTDDAEDDAE